MAHLPSISCAGRTLQLKRSMVTLLDRVNALYNDISASDLERLGNPGWNWSMFERLQQKVERYVVMKVMSLLPLELTVLRFVTPSKEVQAKLKIDFDSWTLGRDGSSILSLKRSAMY